MPQIVPVQKNMLPISTTKCPFLGEKIVLHYILLCKKRMIDIPHSKDSLLPITLPKYLLHRKETYCNIVLRKDTLHNYIT